MNNAKKNASEPVHGQASGAVWRHVASQQEADHI